MVHYFGWHRRVLRVGLFLLSFGLIGYFVYSNSILLAYNKTITSNIPPSALVSLVKQREITRIINTVRNVEDRYNRRFNHDWVFLSEENFKPEFIKTVSAFVSGKAVFKTINRKLHWNIPDHIDRQRLSNDMQNLDLHGVPYGGSNTYRLMSRFQSGFFMDYLPEYRYYARVDPDLTFYCDIEEDFFATLYHDNKKYGFTISLHEVPHTTHNLSKEINQFMQKNIDIIHPNQWLDSFIAPWGHFCHFWSNFEVGDLDFFRSYNYKKLFEQLDKSGGFFYHRWGDAPVHSVALSLFLDPKEIHWFRDIGMQHMPNINCPTNENERLKLKCTCLNEASQGIFTYKDQSCVPQFLNLTLDSFQQDWELHADWTVVNKFKNLAKNQ